MDLDTEETRETHNFYIESIRRSLKNINNKINDIIRHINLKQYLNQDVVSLHVDPLEFWERNRFSFLQLVPIATKYLSIVATSVPCESLFMLAIF